MVIQVNNNGDLNYWKLKLQQNSKNQMPVDSKTPTKAKGNEIPQNEKKEADGISHITMRSDTLQIKQAEDKEGEKEYRLTSTKLFCPSAISACLLCTFPCCFCMSCLVVKENEEAVVLHFGKYIGTLKDAGFYCNNFCGNSVIKTTIETLSMDLGDVKVVDSTGSPLLISGVSTYRVVNSRKAVLNVNDPESFVRNQALSVMKVVVSEMSYDGLKSEVATVNSRLIRNLQRRVDSAGVRIINFELSDCAYAPEISKAMLVRQQAFAMVDARRTIVENAVMIASQAVKRLEERSGAFDQQARVRLLSNLLITITGESAPTPTIAM